jgi:hypothetical protein
VGSSKGCKGGSGVDKANQANHCVYMLQLFEFGQIAPCEDEVLPMNGEVVKLTLSLLNFGRVKPLHGLLVCPR